MMTHKTLYRTRSLTPNQVESFEICISSVLRYTLLSPCNISEIDASQWATACQSFIGSIKVALTCASYNGWHLTSNEYGSQFIWNKGYLIPGLNQKTMRTALQVFKTHVPSLLSASAKNKLPTKLFHTHCYEKNSECKFNM